MRNTRIAAHTLGVCALIAVAITGAAAQQGPGGPGGQPGGGGGGFGGFRQRGGGAASAGPRPYADVITDKAKSDPGLFTVHKIDDRYYYEIPASMLNRVML